MADPSEGQYGGDALVAPRPALTRTGAARLDAIDMLRGLVISIMVLDHVRDFFHFYAQRFDPTDPLKTSLAIYSTRWVTHLCATSFVFLAGVSIFLQKADGKTPNKLSTFLLKRGAWLILLEVTIVSFGFNFAEPFVFFQVIGAIGAGMIAMSVLSRLPSMVVLALGATIITAYPLLMGATQGAVGVSHIIRSLALAPAIFPEVPMLAVYPIIPWLAIMCLGFGAGPLFQKPAEERRRILLVAGVGLLGLFFVLRFLNGYGDPAPWRALPESSQTLMSFFNVSKYPPSLDFVSITLGISLLIFLALERLRGPLASVLLTFGRTPLFTYLCHLYIAHGLMLIVALCIGFPAAVATDFLLGGKPLQMGWGFSLPVVYAVWALVLLMMYPLSRWFERIKSRRRDWWLSYI